MPIVSPRRLRFWCPLLASVAGLGVTAATIADPPPADHTPIASVWVGSEAAVREAADRVGVPLPPAVGVATLEQLFPFFHPGDVRTDAPLGMVYLSGADLTQQQFVVLAVPVKAGAVPLAQLPQAEKTDAADTVTVTGVPFRRTADNLLMMGTVAATSKLDVTAEQAAMRPTADGRTPVLSASIDLATWRKAAPDQFAAAINKLGERDGADPARQAGALWAKNWMRNGLDRFAFAVDQTKAGWTVSGTMIPFPKPHGSFPRPGLPANCAARADMQLSATAVAQWVRSMTNATEATETAAGARLSTTVFLGDAETYGLGMIDGKPAFCCITQRSTPTDLAADIAAIDMDAAAMPKDGDLYRSVSYKAADGSPVYRFTIKRAGDAFAGYIDVTARGNMRYVVISPSDAHLVENLASLPPEPGAIDGLGNGWVVPARVTDWAATFPLTAEQAATWADLRKRSADLFGDSRITWAAKSAGPGATFTIDLPNAVLKAIGQAANLARR